MMERLSEISAKSQAKQFNCSDLVRCVYNLNETDVTIIEKCSNKEGMTIAEISDAIGRDRSTVHRSLEKLKSCGLCYKERRGRSPRAFVDNYRILPRKEILRMAERHLDDCYASIKKLLAEAPENKEG